MQQMGMQSGSVVCIHCAMKEFYNYKGTAEELIKQILDVIGPTGTLVMPAFPDKKLSGQKGYIFNPKEDKTGAGYLAETFRRYPGVKRSLNVRQNALVFNLGMPRSYMGTFHHCVESILRKEHPYYAQFFNTPTENFYYNEKGEVCKYESTECFIERRTRKRRVTRYFTSDDWQIRKISNLEVKVFHSRNALNKMINLARKGITVYYVPSPNKYSFE